MSLNKKFRFPFKPRLSAHSSDVKTVCWAMFALVGVSGTFCILAFMADSGWLPSLRIGKSDYSTTASAAAGLKLSILFAIIAEFYRRGWHQMVSVTTLVMSMVVVMVTPSYAYANGIPQVVWLGPMVAFALTPLSFSIATTIFTFSAIYMIHASDGAFQEISPLFVIICITILLATGKLRHRRMIESEIEQSEIALKAAFYDPVTGLPNRRLLGDRLKESIKAVARNNQRLAVMFIDIDRFKEVNDTLGHDAGDQLLLETARRLGACVRTYDTLGRFGNDVFAILMGGISERSSTAQLTERILSEFRLPFVIGDAMLPITVSIGVAVYPDDGDNTEVLLQRADQTLHNAKAAGGNRIEYFTSVLQESAQYRLRLIQDLRVALQENQLMVYYQPIVDLRTGATHKAEALMRWRHPVLGFISPAIFIPLAEANGLIHELGEWVFDVAAKQVKYWRDRCSYFQMSINRSPVQFTNNSQQSMRNNQSIAIQPSWNEKLNILGLPGDSIALEITEGLLLDNGSHVAEQLQAFKDAGIHISLDDFGTGYSSLAYLQRHPIDVVKIDRAFVKDLTPSCKNFALCRAIVTMAHELGMQVVAEGVETAIERDLLMQVGCDFAQGYFFAKPMSAEDFDAFLRQSASPSTLCPPSVVLQDSSVLL